jgi:hypothetical protein
MNAPHSQYRLEDTLQRLMLQAVCEGIAHAEADLGRNPAQAAHSPQAWWHHPMLDQALINRIGQLADGSGIDAATEDGMDDMLNILIKLALDRRARTATAGLAS